jgi:translation elongation factor EF-Tu-like GTPase
MTPQVLVRLKMKLEESGGRHAAFTEGYRPHFVIPPDGEYLGVIATNCPGPVSPGDEADVEFAFVYHPKVDYSALRVGAEFEMREGPRAVAIGRVLERNDETNLKA